MPDSQQPLQAKIENEQVSILGCGWLGLPLARRLAELRAQSVADAPATQVSGSTTQAAKLQRLRDAGLSPILLRLEPNEADSAGPDSLRTSDSNLRAFFSSPILYMDIPPQTALGAEYHLGQIETLLQYIKPSTPRHLLYVSSASVYGALQGEVDEDSRASENEGGSETLLAAEKRLKQAAVQLGFGLTILRSGGQIGKGRHPGRFLAGRVGVRDPEHTVNLVHQIDLIECSLRLIHAEPPSTGETRVFNIVASQHPTRREFYTEASRELGLPIPEFRESDLENPHGRIVSSEKVRIATGYQFQRDDLFQALKDF